MTPKTQVGREVDQGSILATERLGISSDERLQYNASVTKPADYQG
jgi:hypothetical protein